MAAYEYQALSLAGKTKKGVITADTARQARQLLREQGLTPLSLSEVSEQRVSSSGSGRPSLRTRINNNDLAVITRQFATLLGSGLTIEESLTALNNEAEGHQAKSVISDVRSSVLEGRSLVDSISRYPRTFPEIYRASVAAGEASGNLDLVLERLAEYLETRQGLQQRVVVAMIYPILLTVVALLIIVGLLTYVVPQVVKVFEDTGQTLPLLTRGLISVSEFMQHYGLWLLGLLIMAGVGARLFFKQPHAKLMLHKFWLKLPLFKRISRGLNTARMARTLSIMVNSGVPLLSAMKSSEGVMTNVALRQDLIKASEEVAEGVSIHKALARSGRFPPLLIQMVASGESSGKLDHMLDKAAEVTERELESRLSVLVGLFEPLMILIMGGIVLVIVLAILLPIFDLNQLIG